MRRGGDIMRLTFRKECVKISSRGKRSAPRRTEVRKGALVFSLSFARTRSYFAAYTPSMSVPSRYSTAAMSLS